jgi:hypothetical protein
VIAIGADAYDIRKFFHLDCFQRLAHLISQESFFGDLMLNFKDLFCFGKNNSLEIPWLEVN